MHQPNALAWFALFSMTMACASPPESAPTTPPASAPAAAAPVTPKEQRVEWLKQNAVEIQSIDPEDDDFSDLQPLKKLIGNSRVVALGEQSHGDGAVFYAKGRLIKFLHQEMSFDVLAWESGMFDCREVDRAIKDKSVPMDDVCKRGIFAIWTLSAQVRPTLDYVRSTHTTVHPLETAGFDEQFSGNVPSQFPAAMLKFLEAAGPDVVGEPLRKSLTDNFLGNPRPDKMKVEEIVALREQWSDLPALIAANREELIAASDEREYGFMLRSAENALICLDGLAKQLEPNHKFDVTDNNARDERMGENLAWLANEYFKGRKIIVWEASFHAVHNASKIVAPMSPGMYDKVKTCGQTARESLGESLYTIGFTAYDGKAANAIRGGEMDITEPGKDSLEDLCHDTGKRFLYIDLRSVPPDHWLRSPVISRPLGYGLMEAYWPDQMDAMIYIQTMFPSTRSNTLPEYAKVRADQK